MDKLNSEIYLEMHSILDIIDKSLSNLFNTTIFYISAVRRITNFKTLSGW